MIVRSSSTLAWRIDRARDSLVNGRRSFTLPIMNTRLLLAPLLLFTSAIVAADLPAIPAEPIAKKKELLFSDDFERAEIGKAWIMAVPTFVIENGTLKGSQIKLNLPAADGKPAVRGHQAVIGTDVPTRDSIVQLRFRFAGATAVSVEYDDRNYGGPNYGHICMARVTPTSVIMIDQTEDFVRENLRAKLPDAAKQGDATTPAPPRNQTFPIELDLEKWHELVLETVNDTMRLTIDGKPAGFLKSLGISHPTKSKVEFGCMGKDGYFDDIKIWNAEAVK